MCRVASDSTGAYLIDPSRANTAVPVRGQISQILSSFDPHNRSTAASPGKGMSGQPALYILNRHARGTIVIVLFYMVVYALQRCVP